MSSSGNCNKLALELKEQLLAIKELTINSTFPRGYIFLGNYIVCLTREKLFFIEEFKLIDVKRKAELENYHFVIPCNSHQWIKAFDKRIGGSSPMEGPLVTT